jgi:protocatechuate 3,4-dioxygenase beta subunit
VPETAVLGPFYARLQRKLTDGDTILLRAEDAPPLIVEWTVANGEPLRDALVEVWQTAPIQL